MDQRRGVEHVVHHFFKVHQHQAQALVGFLLRDAVGEFIFFTARAIADRPLAVIPVGELAEALVILDKLDTGLARLQRDGILAAAAVVLVRVFDRGRGPVGVDDEILRRRCGIGNVRAAGGRRVPPGKIHAGARGRLQCGIGLAARIAQDTVVLQRAAVRHMDKVAEAGVTLVSGIVAIEIDLQLADTPLEHFGRIAAPHADPRAPRIGHADLGIVPARQQPGHAAAREHGGAVELQGGQRIELLLRQGQAVCREEAVHAVLHLRQGRAEAGDAAAFQLLEHSDAAVADRHGLRGALARIRPGRLGGLCLRRGRLLRLRCDDLLRLHGSRFLGPGRLRPCGQLYAGKDQQRRKRAAQNSLHRVTPSFGILPHFNKTVPVRQDSEVF